MSQTYPAAGQGVNLAVQCADSWETEATIRDDSPAAFMFCAVSLICDDVRTAMGEWARGWRFKAPGCERCFPTAGNIWRCWESSDRRPPTVVAQLRLFFQVLVRPECVSDELGLVGIFISQRTWVLDPVITNSTACSLFGLLAVTPTRLAPPCGFVRYYRLDYWSCVCDDISNKHLTDVDFPGKSWVSNLCKM